MHQEAAYFGWQMMEQKNTNTKNNFLNDTYLLPDLHKNKGIEPNQGFDGIFWGIINNHAKSIGSVCCTFYFRLQFNEGQGEYNLTFFLKFLIFIIVNFMFVFRLRRRLLRSKKLRKRGLEDSSLKDLRGRPMNRQ